jgi:rare lipoprotein A
MKALACLGGALAAFCTGSYAGQLVMTSLPWAGALEVGSASESPPTPSNPTMSGLATFSGKGSTTASGEHFAPMGLTAGHRTLPFGTVLRVTNQQTGKSAVVRVNDRGPFVAGRILCLSLGAARAIGMERAGVASVKIEIIATADALTSDTPLLAMEHR